MSQSAFRKDGQDGATGATGADGSTPLWELFPGDKPPSSANAKDDEFSDSSLDGKWSWRNQGGASWAEAGLGYGTLTVPDTGSEALRMIEQTAPSTPYTIRARVAIDSPYAPSTACAVGIAFANNSSGKILAYYLQRLSDGSLKVHLERYGSATSYDSNVGSAPHAPLIAYLGLKNDGTNVVPYWSADGVNWSQPHAADTLAAFISSVDRIGIVARSLSVSAAVAHNIYWFRVV